MPLPLYEILVVLTIVVVAVVVVVLQAQKNLDASFNKLRILKMALDNRLEEFPLLAIPGEQNGDMARPVLPRPALLTGTFYLKLHGVEGLLDLYTLRQLTSDMDSKPSSSPPRTYSASQVVKNTARNFMTLPTPNHREREKEKEKERERERERERASMSSEDEGVGTNTWYRRGSKHGRNKNTAMTKQNSLDHIDESSS